MSALATRECPAGTERPQRDPRRAPLFDDGVTLEDMVLGVWEDIVVAGSARCPVCGGSISPDRCEGCGSALS